MKSLLEWIIIVLAILSLIVIIITYVYKNRIQTKKETYVSLSDLYRKFRQELSNVTQSGKENILLLYQKLKNSGEAVLDKLKDTAEKIADKFKAPDVPPKSVEGFLGKYGMLPITRISVCRKPVIKSITTILNYLTDNQLTARVKNLGYDDLFHLYALIELRNTDGKQLIVKMEKNEIVSLELMSPSDYVKDLQNCINVKLPINKVYSLYVLFMNGMAYKPKKFWVYDQTYHNCQDFILTILKGSGLSNPTLEKFINQDAPSLLEGFDLTKKFGKGITDLAANLQHLRQRIR